MTRKWDPALEQYRDAGKFDGNDRAAAAGGLDTLGTMNAPTQDRHGGYRLTNMVELHTGGLDAHSADIMANGVKVGTVTQRGVGEFPEWDFDSPSDQQCFNTAAGDLLQGDSPQDELAWRLYTAAKMNQSPAVMFTFEGDNDGEDFFDSSNGTSAQYRSFHQEATPQFIANTLRKAHASGLAPKVWDNDASDFIDLDAYADRNELPAADPQVRIHADGKPTKYAGPRSQVEPALVQIRAQLPGVEITLVEE